MVPVVAPVSGVLADINPVLESGILADATPVRVLAAMVKADVTLVLVSGVLVAKPVPVSMSGVMCNPGSVVLFVVHNLSLIPQGVSRQDCSTAAHWSALNFGSNSVLLLGCCNNPVLWNCIRSVPA